MLYEANQIGLDFFEREAGYTRSGYHGRRVDGQETGHFDEARLLFAQFLQHSSRDNDIHLHIHNVVAHVARTLMDDRWRAPDTWGFNEVFGALSGIVSLYFEAALTQRFGVEWRPRTCDCEPRCQNTAECRSAFGCDIDGISREVMKCFSSRRATISALTREQAREFEHEHGRRPTQRELTDMSARAWRSTRTGKESGTLDLDKLYADQAERLRLNPATLGAELGAVAPAVWSEDAARSGSSSAAQGSALSPATLSRAAPKALARCQAHRSTFTRYDLLRELGAVMPPEARHLAPAAVLPLLEDLADRTLAGEFAPVACLEAPEVVDVPESLRRSDGRPVYRRHMGTRYATEAHLSLEQQLLADAAREREPLIEPERAARLLGSDSAALSAQLERKPEAGSQETTATGLRQDQAAAIWSAVTDRKTSTVLTGAAGTGKTHTLAAAGLAAHQAGVPHIYGIAASQAATKALAGKLAEMGVPATVLISPVDLFTSRTELSWESEMNTSPAASNVTPSG